MKPALALLRLYAYAARELPPKDVANLFANPQTELSQTPPSQRVHMTAINGLVGRTHYHEIKGFMARNDNFNFFFWDDAAAENLMEEHFSEQRIFEFYQQCPHGIMRADIFRLCVLLIHGGWYFDLKSQFQGRLDTIPLEKGILYLVNEDNKADLENPLLDKYTSGNIIANWVMAALPGLPHISSILDYIADEFPRFNDWRHQHGFVRAVWETTGPRMLTRYFLTNGFAEKLRIIYYDDSNIQPKYACRGAWVRGLIHQHYTRVK